MESQSAMIWAGASAAAIAGAGAVALYWTHPNVLTPAPAPAAITQSAPPPAAPAHPSVAPVVASIEPTGKIPAAPAPPKPAFDVVNVEPTGETVIAGRAAPNVRVELNDGGRVLAEATADANGQFVIIPPRLAPGDHSLSLAAPSGEVVAATSNAVPVSIPAPQPEVAASAPPKQIATASAEDPAGAPKVAVKSVAASPGGRLVASGAAAPNATVRLYLSGAFVGDAKASPDGRWTLTIKHGMSPGAYEVRADEINPADATVVARAETPFDYPAASADAPAAAPAAPADAASSPADLVIDSVQTHHVERGHTLWGISQKFYGDGSRYELIFAANSNQIRNPNLIYPGQMFVVPKPQAKR